MSRILDAGHLEGGYGRVQILHDISLHVDQGEFVTIIGPNGCGKSTFIKVIFGLATHYSGDVLFDGQDVTGIGTHALVRRGIAYVPQTNNIFPSLSVNENLMMGAKFLSSEKADSNMKRVFEQFPDLVGRKTDLAASLSGGQRQMLAIGRALMSEPRLVFFDEPTAALSPLYQKQIMQRISDLRSDGISILMIEQNARLALSYSDRGYIFAGGKVVHTAPAAEMLNDEKIGDYFVGKHAD